MRNSTTDAPERRGLEGVAQPTDAKSTISRRAVNHSLRITSPHPDNPQDHMRIGTSRQGRVRLLLAIQSSRIRGRGAHVENPAHSPVPNSRTPLRVNAIRCLISTTSRQSLLLCWLVAGLLLPASAAQAQGARALPPPGTGPWEALHFPKIEQHTRYEVIRGAQGPSLRSKSECAASGFVLSLDDMDLSETPRLSWRWRIHRGLQIEDEQAKPGDDFAARVYVLFAYDPRRASFLERSARGVAKLLYGRDLPGEAINYVWASRTPVGEQWLNPFSDASHMVALRTHSDAPEARIWHSEEVDLLADRGAMLGEPLPGIEAIAIMTDTDNSCTRASAEFADFRLLRPR